MKAWSHAWLSASAAVVAICLAGPASAAPNIDAPLAFEIAPQGLDTALLAYSRQSGVQVISAAPALANKVTVGVHGMQTPRDALTTLLKGSGLSFLVNGSGAVTIVQRTANPEVRRAAEASPHGAAPLAAAQSAGETQGPALQEVVVTATRRTANLQVVPASVTAVQGAVLAAVGIQTVQDITQLIPSLSVSRNGPGTNLYLRGVGTNSSGFNTEPAIATYIDGFYLPNSASTLFSFNNIERIEVLKGPQGTLYGRNATGGLVHVITSDPSQERLDASIGYGAYDAVTMNLYAAGPLSDTVSAGLAVTHAKQSEGWGLDTFTGTKTGTSDESGVQGKLRWAPSPGTKVTLEGMYARLDSDQSAGVAIYPGSVANDGTPYLGKYRTNSRIDPTVKFDLSLAGLKIEQDLGFANFVSLTGYIRTEANSGVTGPAGKPIAGQGTTNGFLTGLSKTFTQELQLSSRTGTGSPFSWIGGLYYFHDDTVAATGVFGTCVGAVCSPTPVPTLTTGEPTTRSYAAYAEGTYDLAQATRLTLGLRYTRDEKALSGSTIPLAGLPNSPTTLATTVVRRPGDPYPGNPAGIATSIDFPKLTYKAVLAHDITDDVHAYVSYNRGFKSGTYNPTNFSNPPSRPEIVDAYEGGVKSELFDRVLRLNLAAFHYDYKDLQVRTSAPPAVPGTTITYNAAAAKINGVDAEATFVATRALSIIGSVTYLDAKYEDFKTATCSVPRAITATVLGGNSSVACDDSGHRMINSPKLSYNLRVLYTFETTIGSFDASINDSFKSRSYWDPSNRISQAPYHLVNASLTWWTPVRNYDVQLYVRNLTNAYYAQMAQESTNDIYVPGVPRTYGISFNAHF